MKKVFLVFIITGLVLAAACTTTTPQPAATAEPTPLPVVRSDSAIVAEGRLVPARSVELSFLTNGPVAEVLVKDGDQVKQGDVLARLGNREELEASIATAQLELFTAQKELDDIEARHPEALTEALEALTEAKEALRDAERRAGGLNNPTPASDSDIEIARANVAIARKAYEKASDDYKPYENKPADNLTRAALLQKKADAEKKYQEAVRKLNNMLGVSAIDFVVEQAQAELAVAQSRMELAQERYDTLKEGLDPKEVEAVKARIATAETSLAATQAALGRLELVAPIDGTVINLNLIHGQQVTPADQVMMLVDFSKWYVETDNLTEIDVVDVAVGQTVSVMPDALPDVDLVGTVNSISNTFEEKRGDITYTVRILLDEIDPRLRWGMTVVTTFEKQ